MRYLVAHRMRPIAFQFALSAGDTSELHALAAFADGLLVTHGHRTMRVSRSPYLVDRPWSKGCICEVVGDWSNARLKWFCDVPAPARQP